ncbi:MAG TPA: serine protease [Steroidobacteraceae bacterium]|jgi:V8-like Glu-specific endopeptidase|nr:serine protease [Steroidobacteraceae bacterium]
MARKLTILAHALRLWLALLAGACSTQVGASGAASGEPTLACIGEPSEDPSVVQVFAGAAAVGCSGVLVSQSEIMTAAHCVHPDMQVKIGGVRYLALPRWVGGPGGEDVALLELSSPLLTAQPARMATTPPALGDALTLVGYGCTGAQVTRAVTRRSGAYTQGREYDADGCACAGDSGAPVFNADGEVVALNWARGQPALVDVTR